MLCKNGFDNIEGIYISKNVTSLQIKVHEVYVKPLKPRESLLNIKESDGESDDDESDTEKRCEDDNIEDLRDCAIILRRGGGPKERRGGSTLDFSSKLKGGS